VRLGLAAGLPDRRRQQPQPPNRLPYHGSRPLVRHLSGLRRARQRLSLLRRQKHVQLIASHLLGQHPRRLELSGTERADRLHERFLGGLRLARLPRLLIREQSV
jgi:hypothetical protein